MEQPNVEIINLINSILTIITYTIVVRALLSWINPNPNNPVVRLIVRVTEPILRPLRRVIPPIAGMDLTPVVAIILLQVVQSLVPRLLGAL